MKGLYGAEFAHPYVLLLLGLLPLLWFFWWYKDRDRHDTIRYSSLSLLSSIKGKSWRVYMRYLPMVFRSLAFVLFVVALARPQTMSRERTSTTEGIDIMISLDVSGSMLARDFQPDRLEAAKTIGAKFVAGRVSDRMGLVIFSGEAFTMCPLTTDLATVVNQFEEVRMGLLEDGTAIGSGLAMAVNRLLNSDAVSRVVILLTDGVNNSGEIAPYTAAEIAAACGVRVYVIGVGSRGTAPYPIHTPFGVRYRQEKVEIDEPLMREIAHLTGGEYFRATDNAALEKIYENIDQLEKSKIQIDEYTQRHEVFEPFLMGGIVLLILSVLVNHLVFRLYPSER